MQSLFNQFVCTFVQALLIYFLHTLLSLFLTWYWLYCSISCAPPQCKRALSRQILQQNVWGLYNHNLSWAHVQLSIEMNSKVVKRWGNQEYTAKNIPFPAVWRDVGNVSARVLCGFYLLGFLCWHPRGCSRFSVSGVTQQWPLWAQWSWVPFPDTRDVCVLLASGNETLERNREQISARVVWRSKSPRAFATPGIKAGYFAVIFCPHFLHCLSAANPSSRLQSSANHSVFKQWRQGQKRDVAAEDSRCTWGMLLPVVVNLQLTLFLLARSGI